MGVLVDKLQSVDDTPDAIGQKNRVFVNPQPPGPP